MRLLIILIFSLSFVGSPKPKEPVVEWLTETDYDFDDLTHNKEATVLFKYKNISNEPITIDNVRTSCGCTAPDWDEYPVAPDSIGVIKIVYDSEKQGYFRKKIKVFFNSQRAAEKLFINGFVE